MKFNLLTILLTIPLGIFAQTKNFNITGSLKNTENAKYAYLTTQLNQVTESSDQLFMVTEIKDGKFEFKSTIDLFPDKLYQAGCVFIHNRGNITKEEIASKINMKVFITGGDPNTKRIFIEDQDLLIENRNQVFAANITNGGDLSNQLSLLNKTTNIADLDDMVKKHPESPINLQVINKLASQVSPAEISNLKIGNPTKLYFLLADSLQKSKQGLSLKKYLDEKYNIKN